MDVDRIVASADWSAFKELLAENIESGQTFEHFEKQLRKLVEKAEWTAVFPTDDLREFGFRADVLRRAEMRRLYMAKCLDQLRDGNYCFWVYRHDCDSVRPYHHECLDRLVLEADHPFWQKHFPPNGWGCGCHVAGARHFKGALRLGGDPEKRLSENWQQQYRQHPLFDGQSGPLPEAVLPYVLAGTAYSPRWVWSR